MHLSWFAKAHVDVTITCRLIAYFLMINSPQLQLLTTEYNISISTAVDWTNFCREVNILK